MLICFDFLVERGEFLDGGVEIWYRRLWGKDVGRCSYGVVDGEALF